MNYPPSLVTDELNDRTIRAAILDLDRVLSHLSTNEALLWNTELSRYAAFAHGVSSRPRKISKRVIFTGSVIGLILAALDLGSILSFLGFGVGAWLFVYGLGVDIEEDREGWAWLLLQEEIAAAQQRLHDVV